MKRSTIFATAVAVIAGVAAFTTMRMPSGSLPAVPLVAAANAQEAGSIDTSVIQEMTLGSADAPVEIIEYASYTCPHCANFHANVFDRIKKDYVDTGKVRFVYREVYFDRFGLWASMVARCGGEMRFFGITDMLYEQQREWAKGDPAEIADNLRRIGKVAGISDDELNACLQDQQNAQTLVSWYQENADEDGIKSTPSFVIGGKTYNNMSYDDMAKLLDEQLASQ